MKDDTYNYYKVYVSARYTYYLSVKTRYDFHSGEPISYALDFGGKMKGCIRATINSMASYSDPILSKTVNRENVYCSIAWIGYNTKCSVSGDLEMGTGTKHMVKTFMNVVRDNFPWITAFKLSDSSTVKCDQAVISLAALYLVKYGESYYQKHFGAYLKEKYLQNKFNTGKSKLTNEQEKNIRSFEAFNIMCSGKIPLNYFNYVKKTYESEESNTFINFFSLLRKNPNFCDIVKDWLETFVNNLLGSNFWINDWLIDVDSKHINVVTFTLEKTTKIVQDEFKEYFDQSGGRRMEPPSWIRSIDEL